MGSRLSHAPLYCIWDCQPNTGFLKWKWKTQLSVQYSIQHRRQKIVHEPLQIHDHVRIYLHAFSLSDLSVKSCFGYNRETHATAPMFSGQSTQITTNSSFFTIEDSHPFHKKTGLHLIVLEVWYLLQVTWGIKYIQLEKSKDKLVLNAI